MHRLQIKKTNDENSNRCSYLFASSVGVDSNGSKDVLSRNDTYIFKKSVAWLNATLRFSVTCRNYGISNPEAFNRGFRSPQTVNSFHLGRGLDHQRFNNPPAVVYGRIILIPHMTLVN